MTDLHLPPENTTTAVFHYLSPCNGTPKQDDVFTVPGIRSGVELGNWLSVLLEEHWCAEMDSTIDIWTHDTAGNFVNSEVTHCPK